MARHIYDEPTAKQFLAFAEAVGEEVPLYSRLCREIVTDEELLDLARGAQPGQPPPNMIFAAVQYLLRGGVDHPLAAWYPDLTGRAPPAADPYRVFRDFCLSHREVIAGLIRTRRTQTNEVARCLALVPALAVLAGRDDRPVSLVEIGASAGLLLAFDRYRYAYGDRTWGPAGSPVVLTTELRGDNPPLPASDLSIATRLGIDLYPVDITDEDDVRWLDALVWPGHEERRARLRSAVAVSAKDPPPMLAGDALEVLPGVLEAVADERLPVVFHSFALIQWSSGQRATLDGLLRQAGRRVIRIWLEWFGYRRNLPAIKIFEYSEGEVREETLGRMHHHGRWLDWGWSDSISDS